ncbi:hypothetical protein ABZ027_31555 [Streptomyces sp. NPDC006332]|uniref:hypothetical protein n=1 Tax=Streptomyces sp. NPDC006332 TaxID=3155456 RepID=UPI0033BEC9DA
MPGDRDVGVDAQGAGGIAAGISMATWKSAVLRAWLHRIPSGFSRLRQLCGAERPSGLAAGEQPWRRGKGADGCVALAVRHDGAGQLGDGLGQVDWRIADMETYFLGADSEVFGGQPVDCRWSLGVEEEKQYCEAVFGYEGVVVQEPGGRPSSSARRRAAGWAVPVVCCSAGTTTGVALVEPELVVDVGLLAVRPGLRRGVAAEQR